MALILLRPRDVYRDLQGQFYLLFALSHLICMLVSSFRQFIIILFRNLAHFFTEVHSFLFLFVPLSLFLVFHRFLLPEVRAYVCAAIRVHSRPHVIARGTIEV